MGSAVAVESIATGLDGLADIDLDGLSDAGLDALLGDLQHLGHRLDAQLGRVADRWAQRGVWASDASRSAAARLGRRTPLLA